MGKKGEIRRPDAGSPQGGGLGSKCRDAFRRLSNAGGVRGRGADFASPAVEVEALSLDALDKVAGGMTGPEEHRAQWKDYMCDEP